MNPRVLVELLALLLILAGMAALVVVAFANGWRWGVGTLGCLSVAVGLYLGRSD